MTYGTIKVDTVTFTDAGIDKSVTLSGLVQNPTFSGNVTVTGTLSGVTVTGTTANFTSGNFTNISGGTHTITSGVFAAGSAASPSITFTGDLNTGIYSPGADQVAISTGGSGRLFVDASGRVGVGDSAPESILHLKGSNAVLKIESSVNTGYSGVEFDRAADDTHFAIYAYDASHPSQANNVQFYGYQNGSIQFATNSQERLRITSAGLVGVGASSAPGGGDSRMWIDQAGTNDYGLLINASGGVKQPTLWLRDASATLSGKIVGQSGLTLATSSSATAAITIDTSQRVGVGTTSPSSLFHVDTVTNATAITVAASTSTGGQLRIGTGGATAGNQSILSTGNGLDIGTTIGSPITFFTNGTANERLRIDSSGRVGIGTSSPGARLHSVETSAAEGLRVDGAAGGFSLVVEGGTTRATRLRQATIGNSYGGNTPPTDGLLVQGSVGIGTTSPAYKLDIFCAQNDGLQIYETSSGNNRRLRITQNAGGVFYDATYSTGLNAHAWGIGGGEAARIDSSGRLLVGTSSNVNGTIGNNVGWPAMGQFSSTSTQNIPLGLFHWSTYAVDLGGAGGGLGNGPDIVLGRSNSNNKGEHVLVTNNMLLGRVNFGGSDGTQFLNGACIAAAVDGTPGANDMPGRLVFSTTLDGASSPTERLAITSDGSVTTNRSFTATGSGTADGVSLLQGRAILVSRDNDICAAFRRRSSDGEIVLFRRDTTQVGNISVTTTATAYNTSSDYRLKENVTAVTDGITRLQQLKPSRFNFIAEPGKTVDGFIAHEVQAIVPEAITGEKDAADDDGNPIYQGIDQSKLVPLLTAALQEAIAKIEILEAKVAALESA